MSRARRIDITGQRFGRLLVVGFAGTRYGRARWACVCDCGAPHTTYGQSLLAGECRSCGCLNKEQALVNLREAARVPAIRRRTPRAVRELEDGIRGWNRLRGWLV